MADISTTISVDVTGIGELESLASAADEAAAALDKLDAAAGRGLDFGAAGGGAAGLDKMVGQYQAACAKIQGCPDHTGRT